MIGALLVLEHDGDVAPGIQVAACDVDDGASGYGSPAGLQGHHFGGLRRTERPEN